MKIDLNLLDRLSDEARKSPRLRYSFDLRTDGNDRSQRILNALEPGTVVPIHRHKFSAETLIVIRGSLREMIYDEEGRLTDSFVMNAGGTFPLFQVEKGQWHSVECLESGTIIFEAKDGAYIPLAKDDILEI